VAWLSVARLVAGILFSSLAFQNVPLSLVSAIYLFAMVSDLVDGYLARKLRVESYFGKILDLVSDKALTIVSLLYAAARGIDTLPLSLIATREVLTTGARIIVVDGTPLLPTSRALGGFMAIILWGNTLFLLFANCHSMIRIANIIYWASAMVSILTLISRVYRNLSRIKASLADGP
jgi:CDP-diacylglycerol---glycerol-3-phosphate 3-phosphatidyltransferase